MNLTSEEKAIVGIIRTNKMAKRTEINKKLTFGKLTCIFSWRSKDNFWGRFGGGWNWKLGIAAGSTTIIISLLICELIFKWRKHEQIRKDG